MLVQSGAMRSLGDGSFGAERVPSVIETLERGVDLGMHIGAQLYVSRSGVPVTNVALGESRRGVPMSTSTLMRWSCLTKPPVVVALAQLAERGLLSFADRVQAHIPEWRGGGKDDATIGHLATHSLAYRRAWPDDAEGELRNGFDAMFAAACAAEIEDRPGEAAHYSLSNSWTVLAEIIRRTDGRPVDRYVREQVFEPLGLADSWMRLTTEQYGAYGKRIGVLYWTADRKPVAAIEIEDPGLADALWPGRGARGPANELGRFFEFLLGEHPAPEVLAPSAVKRLSAPRRVGYPESGFRCTPLDVSWGLAVLTDSRFFAAPCSSQTFGHPGFMCTIVLADPVARLVVVLIANGISPHEDAARCAEVLSGVYADLGIDCSDDALAVR